MCWVVSKFSTRIIPGHGVGQAPVMVSTPRGECSSPWHSAWHGAEAQSILTLLFLSVFCHTFLAQLLSWTDLVVWAPAMCHSAWRVPGSAVPPWWEEVMPVIAAHHSQPIPFLPSGAPGVFPQRGAFRERTRVVPKAS